MINLGVILVDLFRLLEFFYGYDKKSTEPRAPALKIDGSSRTLAFPPAPIRSTPSVPTQAASHRTPPAQAKPVRMTSSEASVATPALEDVDLGTEPTRLDRFEDVPLTDPEDTELATLAADPDLKRRFVALMNKRLASLTTNNKNLQAIIDNHLAPAGSVNALERYRMALQERYAVLYKAVHDPLNQINAETISALEQLESDYQNSSASSYGYNYGVNVLFTRIAAEAMPEDAQGISQLLNDARAKAKFAAQQRAPSGSAAKPQNLDFSRVL